MVGDLAETERPMKFLIRDRDRKFTASFDDVFKSEGAEVIKAPVRSPRANAFAERFVRAARAECLDWVLVLGRRHLGAVLREYFAHYNTGRPWFSRLGPVGVVAHLPVRAGDHDGLHLCGRLLGQDAARAGRFVVGMGLDRHQGEGLLCHPVQPKGMGAVVAADVQPVVFGATTPKVVDACPSGFESFIVAGRVGAGQA